jgi:hypothetical protein
VWQRSLTARLGQKISGRLSGFRGFFDRITFEPGKMGGRACIGGMRITVSIVGLSPRARPRR